MSYTVPPVDVPSDIAERLAELGAPPSMASSTVYRCLAAQPALLRGWVEVSWSLRNRTAISTRLRELLVIRTSTRLGAQFERDAHRSSAQQAGVPLDVIDALDDWPSSDLFSPDERVALAVCDGMCDGGVSDSSLEELKRQFEPACIVEIIVTCSFYHMVPLVNEALRVV